MNQRTRPDLLSIRSATPDDAAALLEIYRPYVERTAISFESVVPSQGEFAARIEKALSAWSWLVAADGDELAGYAYGTAHRERAAYRWSVEVSAYVREGKQRRGIGRTLYQRLFAILAERGYCEAFAGITLPNDASVALHASLGFTPIGTFRRVGWKFSRWHDVAWMQRHLRDVPPRD